MPRKNRRIKDEDIAQWQDMRPLLLILAEKPAVELRPVEETADAA